MNETDVSAVDKSLAMLLKAEKDFPGYSLDFCSGYVSTDGVLLVKKMLKSSPKARAIVGLNTTNRISAFQMLRDDCGVEVYVYVTRSFMLFHPKIYFGTLNAQAWAMVGSSNLTKSGLSSNIEHNLFITGQRHTEPFISIETQIEAFCQQAYLFDLSLEKELRKIEHNLNGNNSDSAYKNLLFHHGIKPKIGLDFGIPSEACQVALGNFRNAWYGYAKDYRVALVNDPIQEPTQNTEHTRRWGAFCAASVEFLCSRYDVPCPKWVHDSRYILTTPWWPEHAYALSTRRKLMEITPLPFRQRHIFCGNRLYQNKYEMSAWVQEARAKGLTNPGEAFRYARQKEISIHGG